MRNMRSRLQLPSGVEQLNSSGGQRALQLGQDAFHHMSLSFYPLYTHGLIQSSLQPLSVSSLFALFFCLKIFNFIIFTSLNNSAFCETKVRTLDGHFQPGCVGMGHSKGERLLASAQPPAVPEPPVALRVERRICFDVTQLKLREKAMELLEKVGRIWEFLGREGHGFFFCVFFFLV